MDKNQKIQFRINAYLIAALSEGLLTLLLLLLIPGDPKNAWLLGLSKSRLLMVVVACLTLLLGAFIVFHFLKNPIKRKRINESIDSTLSQSGIITTILVLSLTGLVGGLIFLNNTLTTTDLFLEGYYKRLAPWVLWFTLLSAQTLVFLVINDIHRFRRYLSQHGVGLLAILLILSAGFLVHTYLWELTPSDWDVNKLFDAKEKYYIFDQDIYAVFREGTNLIGGSNPYSRVHELGDDLSWNFEIPTYFPVFYLLNWFTQRIGFQDFFYWLDLWRVFFLFANLGTAYLVFYIPYHRYNHLGFAILGSLFWLFSRWSLHITMIYHIDFIAIFFLILSLATWPRQKVISLVSFGLSLGVKQIAIFAFPLYLIWIWRDRDLRSFKSSAFLTGVLILVPLLYIAPFFVWDASGFVKSVLLSATRNAESHFGVPAIDVLLGMSGIPAKIPMLAMMAVTYILSATRKVNHYMAAFLVILIFVNFNSVLFRQYMTWVVPLIPLSLCAALNKSSELQK